jgi:hypothetical protein
MLMGIEEDNTLIAVGNYWYAPWNKWLSATYKSTDNGETWSPLSTATDQLKSLSVWDPFLVVTPPDIQNRDPAPDSYNERLDGGIYFELIDVNDDINASSDRIWVEGVEIMTAGVIVADGWTGTRTPITYGYAYLLIKTTSFTSGAKTVRAYVEDQLKNTLDESWIFYVHYTSLMVSHEFNVIPSTTRAIVYLDENNTKQVWNEFDDHGSLLSLTRLKNEKNWEYKRRIKDAAVHLSNSTYRGLINGITRELGLSLFEAISVNPKRNGNGEFLTDDPYIKFDGTYLYLYSDYANNELSLTIDRYEPGGNYEHLDRLVDVINLSSYFEASINSGVDPYTRSMTILNQSNREFVRLEIIPHSTRFRLANKYLVRGTVFFSNRQTFRNEKNDVSLVNSQGDYYIDYTKGIVTVYNMPVLYDYARYQYVKYPFSTLASPIILHNINDDNFRVKMFNQILQDDGTYSHGLPTELGVDIVNELMSIIPMYWGI